MKKTTLFTAILFLFTTIAFCQTSKTIFNKLGVSIACTYENIGTIENPETNKNFTKYKFVLKIVNSTTKYFEVGTNAAYDEMLVSNDLEYKYESKADARFNHNNSGSGQLNFNYYHGADGCKGKYKSDDTIARFFVTCPNSEAQMEGEFVYPTSFGNEPPIIWTGTTISQIKVIGESNQNVPIKNKLNNNTAAVKSQKAFWYTDMAKAMNKSSIVQKPMFLWFWTNKPDYAECTKQNEEVFKTNEFITWAKQNVVLVNIQDYTELEGPVSVQNKQLEGIFNIDALPTIWFVKPSVVENNLEQLGNYTKCFSEPDWLDISNKIISKYVPDSPTEGSKNELVEKKTNNPEPVKETPKTPAKPAKKAKKAKKEIPPFTFPFDKNKEPHDILEELITMLKNLGYNYERTTYDPLIKGLPMEVFFKEFKVSFSSKLPDYDYSAHKYGKRWVEKIWYNPLEGGSVYRKCEDCNELYNKINIEKN